MPRSSWQSEDGFPESKAFTAGEPNEDPTPAARTQWRLNRVSNESLPKIEIFAVVAGVFSRNSLQVLRIWEFRDRPAEFQKPAKSRAFLSFEGQLSSASGLPGWRSSAIAPVSREFPC